MPDVLTGPKLNYDVRVTIPIAIGVGQAIRWLGPRLISEIENVVDFKVRDSDHIGRDAESDACSLLVGNYYLPASLSLLLPEPLES